LDSEIAVSERACAEEAASRTAASRWRKFVASPPAACNEQPAAQLAVELAAKRGGCKPRGGCRCGLRAFPFPPLALLVKPDAQFTAEVGSLALFLGYGPYGSLSPRMHCSSTLSFVIVIRRSIPPELPSRAIACAIVFATNASVSWRVMPSRYVASIRPWT